MMTSIQIKPLTEALRPLAAIADAYEADRLDDYRISRPVDVDQAELYAGRGGRELLTLAHAFAARAALASGDVRQMDAAAQPLVDIARAYDANELDDEARKFWGERLEHRNTIPTTEVELVHSRGGASLLTLEDAIEARAARAQSREDARRQVFAA